jgi:hypothetical protein
MSSIRSKLKLDEQSFEELLAAAYIVQQHNATLKRASGTPAVCGRCGASLREGERLCSRCAGAGEEFRPGERMQRTWASLWQMGQQQGWWERSTVAGDERRAEGNPAGWTADFESPTPEAAEAAALPHLDATEDDERPGLQLAVSEAAPLELPAAEDPPPADTDFKPDDSSIDLRVIPRLQRADVYLGLAIVVSVLAMLWVLFAASPEEIRRGFANVGPRARVHLTKWERALVKLGIAEAPDPPLPVSRANPTVRVWVDPHTAQYYCAGEEQYGKTADGRFTSQREAQMDQFAPAGRAPCD